MKRNMLRYAVWAAGLSALLTGLALTPSTVNRLRRVDEAVRQQAAFLAALETLEARLAPALARRDAIEQLGAEGLASLESIRDAALPGLRFADTRREAQDVADGWVVRTREVTLEDVPLDAAMQLAAAAAAARPPWRLVKCIVRASGSEPGSGQVVMAFETITRHAP